MIKVRRIGHATFGTPDLDRQLAYYTQVFGLALHAREAGRAFLTTKIGQLAVELVDAPKANCSKLSFEVAPGSDFREMERDLAAEGIASSRRSDTAPGMPETLVFQDPNGVTIELFTQWSFLRPSSPPVGIVPLKLGHVAFSMPDPAAVATFYERVLGFRTSDWIGDYFVFLRCNPDHHTVNFIRGETTGLRHFAFEVKDMAHIQTACEVLGERRIPILGGPLRHGPGHNVAVYHRNPDEQVVEVYIEMDQMKDEDLGYFDPKPWHHDFPQRPKVWNPDDGSTVIWGLRVPRYQS